MRNGQRIPNLQPIETLYNGVRFRSRLEARWAVFFDALGLKWEYEPEAFALPSGNYLPDFRIQGEDPFYLEVKPVAEADPRWADFSRLVGEIYVVFGPPDASSRVDVYNAESNLLGCWAGCMPLVPEDGSEVRKIHGAFAYAKGYRFWG